MKKVFVTGATGFIGQAIVSRFLKQGFQVKALARSPERVFLKNPRLAWVFGDIRGNTWHKEVQGCQVFVHTVGVHGHLRTSFLERLSVELEGTKNAALAAKKAGVNHFIHLSTAYLDIDTDYGRAKKVTQKWLKREMGKGFLATIICPVTVYGPGDKNNLFRLFQAVKRGHFFFVGHQKIPLYLIYIDDLVTALGKVLEQPQKSLGKTIILGGQKSSWFEVVKYIAQKEEVYQPYLHLPKTPLLFLGKFFKKISFLGLPILFTSDTILSLTCELDFDLEKGQKLLGFTPQTPLNQGLDKTVNWYKKEGIL